MSREYNGTVQVNYNDLAKAGVREQHASTIERLQKGDLVLPTVLVDGEMVSAGYVDYFSIAGAIEKARAIGAKQP